MLGSTQILRQRSTRRSGTFEFCKFTPDFDAGARLVVRAFCNHFHDHFTEQADLKGTTAPEHCLDDIPENQPIRPRLAAEVSKTVLVRWRMARPRVEILQAF